MKDVNRAPGAPIKRLMVPLLLVAVGLAAAIVPAVAQSLQSEPKPAEGASAPR